MDRLGDGRFRTWRPQLQRSMRPLRVVVHRYGQAPAEVSFPEDQHPVGDLGSDGQHEAFGEAGANYRALVLCRIRGWQPWECAGILGLEPEKDARSGRAASRAEAAYMRPAGGSDGSGTTEPRWPGKVFQPGDCNPTLTAWNCGSTPGATTSTAPGCYGEE